MTHSWPPPLSAIHTPGKAEQSKFSFPNKVRDVTMWRHAFCTSKYILHEVWLSMWGLWAAADVVLMTFPCVCYYPLAFSLPTASVAVHSLVFIFYGSNTDPGVLVTGSLPQGKTQVSLVGCPEVVPSVGTCWGSWPALQGIYSCCKSRSSFSHPVALASFSHQGLRQALLIRWPAQLGAEERVDFPCYQTGFRGIFATEAGSSVQWCLEGSQKYLPGNYLPVQIQ